MVAITTRVLSSGSPMPNRVALIRTSTALDDAGLGTFREAFLRAVKPA